MVESAFGIMAQRFRVYLRPIAVKPESVDKIIKATCCLHNMLSSLNAEALIPSTGQHDISGSDSFLPLQPPSYSGRQSNSAIYVRELYANYFLGNGAVPWQ